MKNIQKFDLAMLAALSLVSSLAVCAHEDIRYVRNTLS